MKDALQIAELVENQIKGSDIFLVDVKVTSGKITVLADKPSGITIKECITLNRYLTGELEVDGMLETHELEVSSPGMDQPFKVMGQYMRGLGRQVRVSTKEGVQHEGTLLSAGPEGIDLLMKSTSKINNKKATTEQQLHFPFETIKETKLILTF